MTHNIIHIEASRKYDIHIGRNILPEITDTIRPLVGDSRLCILTDSTVNSLYAERLCTILSTGGYNVEKFVIPAGEASKCADNLLAFLNFLAEKKFTRSDTIIAFGGGVVGDLGGLTASLYLRGIKYIQMPTTLLAAVDSSVGGKTAIDIPAGKNLVGTFHQPVLVFCDTELMDSLDADIYRDGCAEIIKYGVILDKNLYEKLQHIPFDREEVVARCVEIKRDVVQKDEFDNGMRGLLNFGHTFGHAIEKLSNFSVSHGSAVAKGMILAAKTASLSGLCDITDELTNMLQKYGFDLSIKNTAQEMYEAILSDKKRRGGKITLVLPRSIGNCTLVTIGVEELLELLNKVIE